MTYKEAYETCQANQGELVSENDLVTWLALMSATSSTQKFWTGFKAHNHVLYDNHGQWVKNHAHSPDIFGGQSSFLFDVTSEEQNVYLAVQSQDPPEFSALAVEEKAQAICRLT
eukprot:maker-scaffold548_size139981-snap-gene-0.21 protein:Tk08557 transcript:maker-scaffold548_size139981-snap-gene-0.21-mRNA-1 annotation:"hypothetical protein CR3_111"